MAARTHWSRIIAATAVAFVTTAAACADADQAALTTAPQFARGGNGGGPFAFEGLVSSALCTTAGGNPVAPFVVPTGFAQTIIASEPQMGDNPDMITQNETGPQAGRYIYRVHELGNNGSVSVTDLVTGVTRTLVQRADWESLDPIIWTPQGTLLFGEETNGSSRRDPMYPGALAGLVYELFLNKSDLMVVDSVVARPALGSKAHEGMRFDPQGNLYSISERNPGYIFRFVPDRRGDLSSGQLYALRITSATGDRTGEAEWTSLDRAAVQIDASAAAGAAGATGYNRPEDVEIATSNGNNRGGSNTLYVAITGPSGPSDNRVIAIDLREPAGGAGHSTAFVYDYVRPGLNTTSEFEMPDNVALDRGGNLYITEDPGGSFRNGTGKTKGDDIWRATPGGHHQPAARVERFASLTDCDAEPTGIYFELGGDRLFVNVQHRGGDGLDKTVAILPQAAAH